MTFVQEQKSLRTDYYTSPESFKRFGEGRCKRVTSTMESPSSISRTICSLTSSMKKQSNNQKKIQRLKEYTLHLNY